MNDTITLADPAVCCEAAIDVARRIEALTLTLAVALESSRKAEIQCAVPDLLAIIRTEIGHMRERAEDAAAAIRRSAT